MSSREFDLEAFNLTKVYALKGKGKTIKALDNVSFKVKKGAYISFITNERQFSTLSNKVLTKSQVEKLLKGEIPAN